MTGKIGRRIFYLPSNFPEHYYTLSLFLSSNSANIHNTRQQEKRWKAEKQTSMFKQQIHANQFYLVCAQSLEKVLQQLNALNRNMEGVIAVCISPCLLPLSFQVLFLETDTSGGVFLVRLGMNSLQWRRSGRSLRG